MQSFTQWKRLNSFVVAKINTEKKRFNYNQSTHQLNPVQRPAPSTECGEILGHGPSSLQRDANGKQRTSSPISSTQDGDQPTASDPFTDMLGQDLEGITPNDENERGGPATYLVEAAAPDDCNPRDWPKARKFRATIIVFWIVFVCGWASAVNSSSSTKAAAKLHVGEEQRAWLLLYSCSAMLSVLWHLVQYPKLWDGTRAISYPCSSWQTYFDNADRSLVWPLFALSPILGPALAPVAGGWIIQSSSLSWQWVDWITLLISGIAFIIAFLFLPGAFSPILLQWKAVSLRKATGDARFKSSLELQDPLTPRLKTNISSLIIFFTREPIVILLGFYLALIYVLVFTFLWGFANLFVDTYGFSQGLKGTAFLAIAVGVLLNTTTMPFFRHIYLNHLRAEKKEHSESSQSTDQEPTIAPEIRLLPAMFCAPLFPISLFWRGWTNYASISVWSDLFAAGLIGFSLMGIFGRCWFRCSFHFIDTGIGFGRGVDLRGSFKWLSNVMHDTR
ncbi:uncharacterized protein PAC_15804 [Phialocephala subalpina]|uniref:Uncharacterized protein n=1 Tax=Phialocephala subalpina TaxID=576137 RepID=A0A1L7XLL4_9HELO|nr:uncharacterized protein PAC_15804 [Phialocephala subalpina]